MAKNWLVVGVPSLGVLVFCGMRIAECGKLSRGNLRKIKCGTFRKLPRRFSAFRSLKILHFRGSQNYRSLALHHRCATDAYQRQASRGPLKNEKNEKWFIGYSSSMLDCTSNKTLKQEHTIQNYNTPVTGLPENCKTPQTVAKGHQTLQTR